MVDEPAAVSSTEKPDSAARPGQVDLPRGAVADAPGSADHPETNPTNPERWLIALDIDGTVLTEDGTIGAALTDQVARLTGLGHEVMLATGRSVASTLPVLDLLGITPEYVVCSNGAITMQRDADAPLGYRREIVETFNPGAVLNQIRAHLANAHYAVEDADGYFRYTGDFPNGATDVGGEAVTFDELLDVEATRVVVISPGHDMEDFLAIVETMGLHRVSYSVGWTAWLDIAPDGVNKSTSLERVRQLLGIPGARVLAAGDGRNDIEMLTWASVEGRAVAMGQAPDDVKAVATEVTASIYDDGLAHALAQLR
ncbi:haloacid dehalogenase [Subtercola boreus]|uniref:Haloacid dehalogenase n=2 Tax=Subtercola boreus TaxID=120213 RepID=A0A3E0WEN8_9MICO|nr:haloacid dehalogenase [Subtercola boreus]RFA24098.1 haloacid dehalogenase [Subtercola boreus]RFA29800.1 haloacid dehalogenase [Subtercola boreus]